MTSDLAPVAPVASSRFLDGVARSGARRIMDLAWSIPDAIHLEIGEPDFTAAPHVVEAAARAMREGRTGYPPTAGLPELRDALVDKLARVNGLHSSPANVVVSNGGCQGLFTALSVVVEEGDLVALPNPGWPNYASMAGLLGARVVGYSLGARTGHHPDPDEIDRLGAAGCRVIVLNSPANPLGTVTPADVLQDVLDVARRRGMWVISDECYDELYFQEVPVSPAVIDPSAAVITVYSFSKTHAMTGWRVGYVVAPDGLAEPVARAQEPLVMGINAAAQYGALAALEDDAHVGDMRDVYRRRRDLVVEALRAAGRDVLAPAGAFYLWLDIHDVTSDDVGFVLSLLEREHVAITPGSAFGDVGVGSVRLSLAASDDALLTAVAAIDRHLAGYMEVQP